MESFLARLLALKNITDHIDYEHIICYVADDGTRYGTLLEDDFTGNIVYHPEKSFERIYIMKRGKTNKGYFLQRQRRYLRSQGFDVGPDSARRELGIRD